MLRKCGIIFLAVIMLILTCGCEEQSPSQSHGKSHDKFENAPIETTPPEPSPIEDFSYEFEDGEAIITGYHGSDRKIVIPAEIDERPVTVIGEECFENYDMTEIYIPDSVTTIEDSAFSDCATLTTVRMSDNVTRISPYTFGGCERLQNFSFPSGLTYIGERAFSNCPLSAEITFPESLESIGDGAFYNCDTIKKVNFPHSLNKIGPYAFEGCDLLADVALPESLTYLGAFSFGGCPSLKELSIPGNTRLDVFSGFGLIYADTVLPCIPPVSAPTIMLIPSGSAVDTEIRNSGISAGNNLYEYELPHIRYI